MNTEKYIAITGASSGIGYETAKAFAVRGKILLLQHVAETGLRC
jgi:short-subunit dehydrogenase